MKSSLAKRTGVLMSAAFLSCSSMLIAQPAASPLTFQGLDQYTVAGARSRAMGGTSIAGANDATALFTNPAELSQLSAIEVRAGGLFGNTYSQQIQHWVPMRPLPGISVLFESLTGTVKDPDSLGIPGLPLTNPWSRLQKQYDNLGPNWSRSSSSAHPLTLAAAMPLTVAGMNIVAGLGVSQVIDLNNYYQNNNSMTPYIGQERPPQVLFDTRTDTMHVKWYQYTRKREGSVYGITPALSATLLPGLTVGASAAFLTGSSDDNESRLERGHLLIAIYNGAPENFIVDTAYYYQTKSGTSTYKGNMFNFGLHLQQEKFNIGVTVKPSMTITRTWNRTVTSIDTTKNPFPIRIDSLTTRSSQESGTDYLKFPFSYSLGIVLKPTSHWTIAFDYSMRNLADAELTSESDANPKHPWANTKAAMRLGLEFRPSDMLALRGGYHQDIQAFSPDGSGMVNEPASGDAYSLGAGFMVGNIFIDLAYEYAILKYTDIYQSNSNYYKRQQNTALIEVAYRF